MPYPFDNLHELGWKPHEEIEGAWTRPLSGAELVLDQVRRLNDGMNDLVACLRITHNFPDPMFHDRFIEAWLRLRFASPLIAAQITRGPSPTDLGQWVYEPVSYEGAQKWVNETLQFILVPKGAGGASEELMEAWIKQFTKHSLHNGQDDCPKDERWLFYARIMEEDAGGKGVGIILHASHTILDGPALLDCLHMLLEDVMSPERGVPSSKLPWGKEIGNLPPHQVELVGGVPERWETEGPEMLKEFDEILKHKQNSHKVLPQNPQRESEMTQKVSHVFTPEQTSKIIQVIKSVGGTVTVAFEAAHVLASLHLQPPTTQDGVTVLFPSIVAVRHLMQEPWNKKSTLVGSGGAIPLLVSHSDFSSGTEREKMETIMKDLKRQYRKWLANPHHPMIVPAQQAMSPIQQAITHPDAEITNLGVIETRLPGVWNGLGPEGRQYKLSVDSFHLSLRRTAPILMTHVWTLKESLHIQCQGSDRWDAQFMQKFLDEIVRLVSVLTE